MVDLKCPLHCLRLQLLFYFDSLLRNGGVFRRCERYSHSATQVQIELDYRLFLQGTSYIVCQLSWLEADIVV